MISVLEPFVESVLVELVPEHTAFQKQLGEGHEVLKEHQLMMGWEEPTICGLAPNEGTELVPLINCVLCMMSADYQLTFLSFFPIQNTNCKFIFPCPGMRVLVPSIKCSSRTMCSYKENKVFVVFIKFCHS